MLLVTGQKLLARFIAAKPQPARQLRQGFGILRQAVGLPVIHHLQMMLDGSQEYITIRQDANFLNGNQVERGQAGQGIQGVACQDLRVFVSISQLQQLDGKFDVPDRTFSQLNLTPTASILA